MDEGNGRMAGWMDGRIDGWMREEGDIQRDIDRRMDE